MAQTQKYVPICIWCGAKMGSEQTRSNGTPPTSNPPASSSKCGSSPTGKHAPKWEKV